MPLNRTHRSDYYFGGEDGKTRQFSRKQAGELLGNIDEAEDQLRDYYNNADENYQIVEGIISPVAITKRDRSLESISIRKGFSPTNLYTYKITEAGHLYDEHTWNTSSSMLDAWEYRLEQAGIYTYYRVNWVATAKLLAAIYKNCQKPPKEHTTLQRIINPKIVIHTPQNMTLEELKRYNYIKTLMGLAGAELGETKATALVDYFNDPISLFMASIEEIAELEGFGKKTAQKILVAIGREL